MTIRYTKAWSREVEGLPPLPSEPPKVVREFVRSPGFNSELECALWLAEQGASSGTFECGPDGLLRGTAEVVRSGEVGRG